MSTPAPQDPRPGLPPYRLPRKPQEPLQECVCLPGPGPTLRLPPTPQGALFQRHRTPEGSGPIPLACTGCHPGNRGHGGGRGLLHRDAGPDAAGGHCQSRSAAPRSQSPRPCQRKSWALGTRGEAGPSASLPECQFLPGLREAMRPGLSTAGLKDPVVRAPGEQSPTNQRISAGDSGSQWAPGPGAGYPHNMSEASFHSPPCPLPTNLPASGLRPPIPHPALGPSPGGTARRPSITPRVLRG